MCGMPTRTITTEMWRITISLWTQPLLIPRWRIRYQSGLLWTSREDTCVTPTSSLAMGVDLNLMLHKPPVLILGRENKKYPSNIPSTHRSLSPRGFGFAQQPFAGLVPWSLRLGMSCDQSLLLHECWILKIFVHRGILIASYLVTVVMVVMMN